MQLLVNRIGVTRITFALFVGFLFKLVGIKGTFYRLTGSESSLIDDISGTVTPYDKSIVMGPLNAELFCREVSNHLNINVAVVDVNDLGGVKVLASSNKVVNKIGVTRITFALFVGFLFKLFGIKGMFYRLTGSESSLIDDISGTVTPYDKSIVTVSYTHLRAHET